MSLASSAVSSPAFASLWPILHGLADLRAPAGVLAAGFSIILVVWLVALEEADLRRGRGSAG